VLTKDQAKAAADAVMAPNAAEAAEVARRRQTPEPNFIQRAVSRAMGRWTTIISVGAFTIGLLTATWLEIHALAGAGLGWGAGALVGLYFDRRVSVETFVVVVVATAVIAYSILVMAVAP
jgi:hypothetical protein